MSGAKWSVQKTYMRVALEHTHVHSLVGKGHEFETGRPTGEGIKEERKGRNVIIKLNNYIYY